ncbi:hypothetical protein WEI85_36335 [Actinomycetes bacterium KLBMP 9797]
MTKTLRLGALALAAALGTGITATATASQADLPAPTRTAPVAGAASTTTQQVMLSDVRHARHDRYDRVVFDFTGAGTPGYRVEYGPLVGIGTGTPIPLEGPADLRIVFDGVTTSWTHGYTATPRYPTLRQIKSGGAFEGRMLIGLGLADRVGFRVLRLANPPRIAVDVAHQPTQPFGTARFQGGSGEADVVSISAVRFGRHPGYDRYVFDLRTQRTPLISVAYVRATPTRIHVGLTAATTRRATVTGPHPPNVTFAVYDNGTVSAFIDTNRRAGFRVLLLTNPTRVAVDVAR